MLRRYRLGWLICGVLVCAVLFAERKSRYWRVPSYQVSIPAEFDIEEDVDAHGKRGEVYRFSSRQQYLHYHKRGWEIAKNEWVNGRSNRNYLVQAASPANEAMNDGRQQFQRAKLSLTTLPNMIN